MNRTILCLLAVLLASSAGALAAAEYEKVLEEKIVIALNTDDFAIEETDLSHLAVGDAETIVTESGKTVDLLRTEDGIEVYIDGELVDTGGMHDEKHVVHTIRIVCDDEGEDCSEDMTWMESLEDVEIESLQEGGQKFIVISTEDGEFDVEQLPEGAHEVHGTVHIVKEIDVEVLDEVGEMHGDGEHEVIIIKKKVGEEI
jgi:hypothetical protein